MSAADQPVPMEADTLESQIEENFRMYVEEFAMTPQEALDHMAREAQNKIEVKAIKKLAVDLEMI